MLKSLALLSFTLVSCTSVSAPSAGLSPAELSEMKGTSATEIFGKYCQGQKQVRKFELVAFLPQGSCKGKNVLHAQRVLEQAMSDRVQEASYLMLENFLVDKTYETDASSGAILNQYDWCGGESGNMSLIMVGSGFYWAPTASLSAVARKETRVFERSLFDEYIAPTKGFTLEGAMLHPRNANLRYLKDQGTVKVVPKENGLLVSVSYNLSGFCRDARMKGEFLAK